LRFSSRSRAFRNYFLPNLRQSKKQVLVGALFTTIGWSVVTVALRVRREFRQLQRHVRHDRRRDRATHMDDFSMLVFLIGGEINSEVHYGTGAVTPRPGLLYGGPIETAGCRRRAVDRRVERLEPLAFAERSVTGVPRDLEGACGTPVPSAISTNPLERPRGRSRRPPRCQHMCGRSASHARGSRPDRARRNEIADGVAEPIDRNDLTQHRPLGPRRFWRAPDDGIETWRA
jgi:hypothetical protein